jgi:hypothetical protein
LVFLLKETPESESFQEFSFWPVVIGGVVITSDHLTSDHLAYVN